MKLKSLALVVALLAAVSALVYWQQQRPVVDPGADPRVGQSLVARPVLEQVRGLSLTSEGKSVAIAADASGHAWTVPDYYGLPADFSKISAFIESLQTAKVTRFVTERPDRLERLGFGNDKIELRDATGKVLWNLVLGKNADTGGRFVRFGEEKKGYLADLNAWLDTAAKNWAQAQLLEVKPEDVAAMSVQFPDGSSLTAKRAESGTGWTAEGLPEGKELKTSTIDSLISQLTSLRFTETTEPAAPDAVAAREHPHSVVLTLKDGTAYTIALGRKPAPAPKTETQNAELGTQNAEPTSATTPAVTLGAKGKPEVVIPPPVVSAPSAQALNPGTQNPKPETVAGQPPPPPPPQPGPVFAFISANRADAPVNGSMQKRAFQVGEYVFTSLPAGRDALLQDKPAAPPAPPPAKAEPVPAAATNPSAPTPSPATAAPAATSSAATTPPAEAPPPAQPAPAQPPKAP
jgi:hypothetical protein